MSGRIVIPFLVCLLPAVWGCKDPYVAPYIPPPGGYLVVEGYISGNTVTQFRLTKTLSLPGDSALPTVNDAVVQVEASDNSVYPLTGQGSGYYSSIDTLSLDPKLYYRLQIRTSNGEVYLSDSVPFKSTPPIDSINWVENASGVTIYANTHDPANATRYYEWSYDDVFEFHAAESSGYFYDANTVPPMVVPRSPDSLVYRCWKSGSSTNLILGSSIRLAQDVIYEQPVKLIPQDDIQLSVLYSILVHQYALTADGYNFLNLMKQNSEALGSIFDAQPTQLTSNIHCLTHPAEQVIGWVSAGTVQQQRLFISRAQLTWNYIYTCPAPDTAVGTDPYSIKHFFGDGGYLPLYPSVNHSGMPVWESNLSYCVDCRLQGEGGTNQKPSYWPY